MIMNKYNNNIEVGLIEFFDEILENKNKYDVIVFTTRKCFVLFKQYKRNKKIKASNITIISSKAINIYAKKFCNKKVLLVDDILIHGKSLYRLRKQIAEYSPKNVDISVFLQKYDPKNIAKNKFNLNNTRKYLLFDNEWRLATEKLILLFKKVNIPYTCYVMDMSISNEDYKEFLDKLNNDSIKNVSDGFSVLFGYNKRIENIADFSVLRFYHDTDSSFSLSPYVQLKNTTKDSILNIWKYMSSINDNLNKISCENIIEIGRAITAIISFCEWYPYIKCNINKFCKLWEDELDYSFYEGFSKDIINISENHYNEFLDYMNNNFIVDESCVVSKDDPYFKLLNTPELWCEEKNRNNPDLLFNSYIQYVSDFKEKDFNETLNKNPEIDAAELIKYDYSGIPFINMLNLFEYKKKEQLIISYLVGLEKGYISADISLYNNILFSCIRTGERSWKLIYINNSDIFIPVAYLYRICNIFPNIDKFNTPNKKTFINNILVELSEKFGLSYEKMNILLNIFNSKMLYSIDNFLNCDWLVKKDSTTDLILDFLKEKTKF